MKPSPPDRVARALGLGKLRLSDGIQVHDRILMGLPRTSVCFLVRHLKVIRETEVFGCIGLSKAAAARMGAAPDTLLSANQSSRLWLLTEVLLIAQEVLGSREAAERWIATPAIALNARRPIDLMSTPQGAELVKRLLAQLDHGVYT
jgi:putative toxin-antitoxin system antitoxin component (TIGR02293 family)